jgi:PAS domain S-box-containing protein
MQLPHWKKEAMFEQFTNVLVIEDNPGDADLIRALFHEAAGEQVQVESAERLQEGLSRLSLGGIDLVLLDLSLPDSQGLSTLHATIQAASEIPVVVMTGFDDEATALDAVKQGAQDYLVKGRVGAGLLARTCRYAIERSKSQRTLRESHRLTQQIVDILYIYDAAEQRIIYGSPRFCALLGIDPSRISSTRPSLSNDLVHPDDRGSFVRQLETLSKTVGEEPVEGHFRVKAADGSWRWLQARQTVFTRDGGRRADLILGTAQDVTEHKRLEEKVAEMQQKLSQSQGSSPASSSYSSYSDLDDHSPDMMALIDMMSGKVVHCNQAFALAIGRRKADLIGLSSEELPVLTPADFTRPDFAAVQQGAETVVECKFSRSDGTTIDVVRQESPVRDESGRVVAKRATWRDITDRKRAEQRIEHQAQELAKAQAELADFAYIASHDLKEPLRGILNYASFILEDSSATLDEKARERLETIVRLARRQENLVDTMLHYSELGNAEVVRRPADLQTVLLKVTDSLQPAVRKAGVDIRMPQPLPTVECDATLALELFYHLITNAIKFNDKPQKWVEIGFEAGKAGNAANQSAAGVQNAAPPTFYVRDNGIGVSEKHRATIFRFLKRLHGRDEYGGGVGAGLALVRKIVEKHGGNVWLDSSLGQGTTFFFTLCPDQD